MRRNKTSKNNRTTYTYYSVNGIQITLHPGENGVTEADIIALHQEDDTEFDQERRENYHIPVHYQSYKSNDGDGAEDRNNYLADDQANPEKAYIASLTQAERAAAFREIWEKLLPQQRELVLKKSEGMPNTSIADEENVSETAIRNRLAKIRAKFEKLR